MDRNKIIEAMAKKTIEIYNSNEQYNSKEKRGMLVVQIRSAENPDQWDTTIRSFGTPYDTTGNGFSMDTTVHEKIAYVRRTGKKSGAEKSEVVGTESFWEGAIISDDGNCICAFSGFEGTDDVLIAKDGLAVYEGLKGTSSVG